MNKEKVKLLKRMLKGLTPKRNFHPDRSDNSRPHCVIGEKNLKGGNTVVFPLASLVSNKDWNMCIAGSTGGLTHEMALAIIRRAIKRWSK